MRQKRAKKPVVSVTSDNANITKCDSSVCRASFFKERKNKKETDRRKESIIYAKLPLGTVWRVSCGEMALEQSCPTTVCFFGFFFFIFFLLK